MVDHIRLLKLPRKHCSAHSGKCSNKFNSPLASLLIHSIRVARTAAKMKCSRRPNQGGSHRATAKLYHHRPQFKLSKKKHKHRVASWRRVVRARVNQCRRPSTKRHRPHPHHLRRPIQGPISNAKTKVSFRIQKIARNTSGVWTADHQI